MIHPCLIPSAPRRTYESAYLSLGVERGDRVVTYMPMTPEALIGMYACARIGAVHSVVFGGFAPNELAVRIDDARPKVVLTASCGIEVRRIVPYQLLLDQALAIASHAPSKCVVLQRDVHRCTLTAGRDLDWHYTMRDATPVGLVSNFKQVAVVTRLPKTRSGKVLRKTMRTIADGEPYSVPPTIDDPATLDEIAAALRTLGLAHASTTNIG